MKGIAMVIVVQSLSYLQLFVTPQTAAHQASLSITYSRVSSNPLGQWGYLISSSVVLFSSFPQSFPGSGSSAMSQLFLIRWPKYCSFRFSISPSSEYSRLISFRIDWLDLLAVQGTLQSLLQHHNWKASILQLSDLFMVQVTSVHDYWKNHSFGYIDLCGQSNVSTF